MDDTTPGGAGPGGGSGPSSVPGLAGGGPVAERMQALLSRAVEEQVSEQRQASAVIGDLRAQVAAVAEQVRSTASGDRVEQLAGDLGSLMTEMRRATAGLHDQIEALSRRVEEQASSSAEVAAAGSAGTEALAVRLGALGADLSVQTGTLERISTALEAMSTYPDAFAALQDQLSGLHDRLAPLQDVRSGIADLSARTAAVEALRPELGAVSERVQQLASADDVTRVRDSVVTALSEQLERLERLEELAGRPAVTTDDLDERFGGVRERLDEIAAGGPALERLGTLEERLGGLEERIADLADSVSEVASSAGAVPAVATDVAQLATRLQGLDEIRSELAALGSTVAAVRDDTTTPSLLVGVTSLREDVEDIGSRVDALQVPSADQVAQAVSGQVGDRIVDALAPRVADAVLTRVAAVLVEQVASTVTASVQNGLTERVRAATAESERRMSAHVDEAILALAEALLRRRRPARVPAAEVALAGVPVAPPAQDDTPAQPETADVVAPPPVDGELDEAPKGLLDPADLDAEPAAEEPTADGDEHTAAEHTLADEGVATEAAAAEAEDGPGAAEDATSEPVAEVPVSDDEDAGPEGEPAGDAGDVEPVQQADQPSDDEPTDAAGADAPPTDATPDEDSADPSAEAQADGGDAAEAVDVMADETLAGGELAEQDRAGQADETADGTADGTADETADETEGAAGTDVDDAGESASERTGALALRSGLRGLGLEVDDPDLGDGRKVPTVARPAPSARPRLLDPTPDLEEDDEEPLQTAPGLSRPQVPQRGFEGLRPPQPAQDDDTDEEPPDASRRRPWWRPGG